MASTVKKAKDIFSRGMISVYKDTNVTCSDLKFWIKLTLRFEDPTKTLKQGMPYIELIPRYAELFQSGVCGVGFGLFAKQSAALGKYWTHEYIVNVLLGLETIDHYSKSKLINKHCLNNITKEDVQNVLSKFVGSVKQFNPPILQSEFLKIKDTNLKKFNKYSPSGYHSNETSPEFESLSHSLDQNLMSDNYSTIKPSSPRIKQCYSIDLLELQNEFLQLKVVSDGLFSCRALVRDLGLQLGCHAAIDSLHLSKVGPLQAELALKKYELHYQQIVDSLEKHTPECKEYLDNLRRLYPDATSGYRYI